MAQTEEVDLNFKMSKKIAQLTKVIYQLNCRNEDSDVHARIIADRYEGEITCIMADAKDKLTSLRDALNAKNDDDKVQRVIKEMTKLHQKEKDDATKKFDEFREKVIRNEQTLKQNFEERVAAMSRELAQCKEDFAKSVKDLRDQQSSSNASGKKEFDDILARKNKEMDDLVKEYNEKYKKMLAEQLDAQDQLEKRLNDEWKKKYDALQAQLKGQSGELGSLLADEKNRVAELMSQLATTKTELSQSKQLAEDRETDIVKLRQRVEHFDTMNANMGVQLKASEEKCHQQKAKLDDLEGELKEMQVFLTEERKSAADLRARFDKLGAENTALSNELAVAQQKISSLESQLKELLAEKEQLGRLGSSMGTEVQQLTQRIQSLQSSLDEEKRSRAALEKELAELRQSKQQTETELHQTKKDWQDEVASLRRSYEETLARLQSSSSASSEETTKRHQAALEALRKQLEQDKAQSISSLESSHKAAVNALGQQHHDVLEKTKWAHDKATAAEAEKHNKKVGELEDQIKSLNSKLSGDASSAQADLDSLRKELQALKTKAASDLEARDAQMQRTIEDHKKALQQLQDQLAAVSSALDKERVAKESALGTAAEVPKLQERIKALEAAHAKELSDLRAKHAKDIEATTSGSSKDAADRLRKELDALRKELTEKSEKEKERLLAEHKSQVDALKNAIATAAKESADKITKLEAELRALQDQISKSDASSASLVKDLQRTIEELTASHAANVADIQRSHQLELKSSAESLASKHAVALAEAQDRHAKAVAELEAKLLRIGDDARLAQKDMEENFKNRSASLEKRKDEERDRLVKELEDKLKSEMESLSNKHAKELDDLRRAKSVVEREVTALTAEIESLKQKLATLAERLESTIAAQKRAAEEASKEKDSIQAAHREATALLNTQHQSALDVQEKAANEKIETLTEKYDAEKKVLVAKVKALQKMVADLEYKYANRESRTEDVEKINQLLRDNKEKEEALLKAYNDMKFYKLELHNREENFNKMFGRQPSIASGAGGGGGAAADANTASVNNAMQAKPQQNPSSAPSKMENAQMPPNMRRKSVAAEK
ncbi:Hypothetical protein, putative [Bodo saltans]|uniref:Protein FAM184A/B N-terminal domain-containing protein n=1 Tax=Bodo saltans TaxID=75058 RepID=A0A0S4JCQ5_BODSA|nr:Hypothetical protein, putative [Bodo saltans]|eukprot:CUG86092.1 Hypothetical protein, putative [Bodo saltans]